MGGRGKKGKERKKEKPWKKLHRINAPSLYLLANFSLGGTEAAPYRCTVTSRVIPEVVTEVRPMVYPSFSLSSLLIDNRTTSRGICSYAAVRYE